jgi:hypothetical protein
MDEMSPVPPAELWEHSTVDDASAPRPSWGLRKHVLDCLKSAAPLVEVHTRLQKLYPELSFFHMPSEHMSVNREGKSTRLEHTHETCSGTSIQSERGGPSNSGTSREHLPHRIRNSRPATSSTRGDHGNQMKRGVQQLGDNVDPRRLQDNTIKRQCSPTGQVASTDQREGENIQLG